MLKVLGRRTSSNVQKVLWCLDELGQPFTREDYGGEFGRNNDPEYLALNPNGVVPTLIDGELVFWESNTILRYVASKYGATGLYPVNPVERALCERWMDWQLSNMSPAITPLFIALIRTAPEKRDEATIAWSIQRSRRLFAILDDVLSDRQYLNGSALTLADLCLGISAFRWFEMPVDRGEVLPYLEKWYSRLRDRSAFRVCPERSCGIA